MAEIRLTKGYIAIVDDEDFPLLSQFAWWAHEKERTVYARAEINGVHVSMHRLIMQAPDGSPIDHRDGNGLNNRRANLRFATPSQNQHNRRNADRPNFYRGITHDRRKWRARLRINGRTMSLGTFTTPEAAALAYNAAALEVYGDYAFVNTIQ